VSHRLAKRVLALEARLLPPPEPPRYRWITCSLPKEAKANLSADQRVVFDVYRDCNGMGCARERITDDPEDQGRAAEPGGYLEDVIREMHETCPLRDQPGWCAHCYGTPVGTETELRNSRLEKPRHSA
jgi:hypothetical protein